MPEIHLSDVSVRRRGKTILGPVDLRLTGSRFTIVLGPNGSGKTTLLKVLHGVERISAGKVHWSVPEAEARQTQAYVFQRPILLRRSVRRNLAFPLELVNTPKPQILQQVETWAENVGLRAALDLPAQRLSGGEKQKLALARALIRKPGVLFLDEPCANLDGRSTREIETILTQVNSAGTRIIMSTHDLGQARRLGDEVLFLLKGRLHEQGPARDMLASARTPEARAFFQGDIVE